MGSSLFLTVGDGTEKVRDVRLIKPLSTPLFSAAGIASVEVGLPAFHGSGFVM